MSYFYEKVGLNADLKRHSDKEKELLKLIEESESPYKDTFKYLLNKLIESKAQVANQIGRKNDV